jgi:transposase
MSTASEDNRRWEGIPDNRVTGGVGKHTKSRKVVSRVATALRRAAQSAANSRSALSGFYRRLRARLGPAKAITATAHKLARIFYRMWKYREPYHPLSLDHYENPVPRAHPRVATRSRPRIRTRSSTGS